jgi:hypothetical protein
MGPKTAELHRLLGETLDLLETHGEQSWSARLRLDRARLEAGDFEGITHLLSLYGGMGSFNDLVLHPWNGHSVPEGEIDAVNRELERLRGEMHTLAHEIRREAVFEE